MWTVTEYINIPTFFPNFLHQCIVKDLNLFFRIIASGNSGLIANNNQKVSVIFQKFNGIVYTGDHLHLINTMGIMWRVFIKDAITVKEDNFAHISLINYFLCLPRKKCS